ncbi:unnamed protein product, partial [Echinostoma caproni]|uniref:TORC_M domain-containing protein n=1 Tax=Echinostoma caproni TaxID=27848 RepID=A0A183BC93_9TREM
MHSSSTLDFSGSDLDLPPLPNRLSLTRCDDDPDEDDHLKQLTLQVPGHNNSCRTSPIQSSMDRNSPSFFLPPKHQQQQQSMSHANTPPASLLGAPTGDVRCRSAQGLVHVSPPVRDVKSINSLAYCSPEPNPAMCNPITMSQPSFASTASTGSMGMPVNGDRIFGTQNLKREFGGPPGPVTTTATGGGGSLGGSGHGPPNVSEFLALSGVNSSNPGQSTIPAQSLQPQAPSLTQHQQQQSSSHSLGLTSSAYNNSNNNANCTTSTVTMATNNNALFDSVNSLLLNDPSQSTLPTI